MITASKLLGPFQRQKSMKVLRDVRPEDLNAWFQEATAAAAEQALGRGPVVGTDESGRVVEASEPIESERVKAQAISPH